MCLPMVYYIIIIFFNGPNEKNSGEAKSPPKPLHPPPHTLGWTSFVYLLLLTHLFLLSIQKADEFKIALKEIAENLAKHKSDVERSELGLSTPLLFSLLYR